MGVWRGSGQEDRHGLGELLSSGRLAVEAMLSFSWSVARSGGAQWSRMLGTPAAIGLSRWISLECTKAPGLHDLMR